MELGEKLAHCWSGDEKQKVQGTAGDERRERRLMGLPAKKPKKTKKNRDALLNWDFTDQEAQWLMQWGLAGHSSPTLCLALSGSWSSGTSVFFPQRSTHSLNPLHCVQGPLANVTGTDLGSHSSLPMARSICWVC